MNPPTHQRTAQAQDAEVPTSEVPTAEADDAVQPHPVSATVVLLPLEAPETPRFKWATKLVATEAAGPNARLRVRTRLTVARWPGNVDAASRVADKLVDNAFRHAKPFGSGEGWIELRLTLKSGTDELLMEVDDASPEFSNFQAATTADPEGPPPGLWWVGHYQGTLSWNVKTDNVGTVVGKTVQALIPTTWGEPA
ncbi:hypothetical protein ACWCQN_38000 [Streptomyces sp. NPDC001984]